MSIRNLDRMFRPASVAVIGASNRERSVGRVLSRNLLSGGFEGPVLPVNPKAAAIGATLAYPSVEALPFADAEFDDGDVSLIHAMTQSGVQISISGTSHDPRGHDVRFEVFGSKDSLSAGLSPRTPLNLLDSGIELSTSPYTGFVDRFREAFRDETKAYIEWISGNRNNPCPPDSARSGICVAIACEISTREKRVVKVSEVRGS